MSHVVLNTRASQSLESIKIESTMLHAIPVITATNLAVVLVQSIRDQTNSRLAHQIGRGFSSKTQRIQPVLA